MYTQPGSLVKVDITATVITTPASPAIIPLPVDIPLTHNIQKSPYKNLSSHGGFNLK